MTRDFYGSLPFLQERISNILQTGSRSKLNGYQVKRSEREVRHFQLSSVEVKNERNYTSSPATCFSGLYRNNFTFYLDISSTLFLYFLFSEKIINTFLSLSIATANYGSWVKWNQTLGKNLKFGIGYFYGECLGIFYTRWSQWNLCIGLAFTFTYLCLWLFLIKLSL